MISTATTILITMMSFGLAHGLRWQIAEGVTAQPGILAPERYSVTMLLAVARALLRNGEAATTGNTMLLAVARLI